VVSQKIPSRTRDGKLLVFDFSDEFLAMGKNRVSHLRELVQKKPVGISDRIDFLTYARPDQIDSYDVAKLMHEAGVRLLSLGIESGHPEMLIRMNRRMTLDDHRRAVRLLSETGIKVYLNLLLGGFNETSKSLRSSVEHFKELVELADGAVYRAGARFVIPFPGSLDFTRLLDRLRESGKTDLVAKAERFEKSFNMDPAELEQDFIDHCTSISLQEGIDAHAEMLDFARKRGIGMSDKPFLS